MAQTITGTQKADRLAGTKAAKEYVYGLGGDDFIIGDNDGTQIFSRGDYIYGGDGNDRIEYDAGNDLISGGRGNDRIDGGDGHDRIWGDQGNDIIDGSSGNDQLYGGAGKDSFQFVGIDQVQYGGNWFDFIDPGHDIIMDFEKGVDHITIRYFIAGLETQASRTIRGLELDTNHNGILDDADRYIEVERVSSGGSTKLSTVIEPPPVLGFTGDSLTLFGVVNVKATDVG